MRFAAAEPQPAFAVEVAEITHTMANALPVRDLSLVCVAWGVEVLARDLRPLDNDLADLERCQTEVVGPTFDRLVRRFDDSDLGGRHWSADASTGARIRSASSFAEDLANRGLARSTRARKLAAVRGCHRFVVVEGMADEDDEWLRSGKSLSIRGLTPGVGYDLAECCHPVPGDRIVGLRKQDKGVEVHAIDCHQLATGIDNDWLDLSWGRRSRGAVGRLRVTLDGRQPRL